MMYNPKSPNQCPSSKAAFIAALSTGAAVFFPRKKNTNGKTIKKNSEIIRNVSRYAN